MLYQGMTIKQDEAVPLDLDDIMINVGEFGRFHNVIDFTIALSYFFVGFE